MFNDIDKLWSNREWREVFRAAGKLPIARGVLGYEGSLSFDLFDMVDLASASAGEPFGASWIVLVKVVDSNHNARWVFISCKYECTIGNGEPEAWDHDFCTADVQIGAKRADMIRLAMGTEDRDRLGFTLESA